MSENHYEQIFSKKIEDYLILEEKHNLMKNDIMESKGFMDRIRSMCCCHTGGASKVSSQKAVETGRVVGVDNMKKTKYR